MLLRNPWSEEHTSRARARSVPPASGWWQVPCMRYVLLGTITHSNIPNTRGQIPSSRSARILFPSFQASCSCSELGNKSIGGTAWTHSSHRLPTTSLNNFARTCVFMIRLNIYIFLNLRFTPKCRWVTNFCAQEGTVFLRSISTASHGESRQASTRVANRKKSSPTFYILRSPPPSFFLRNPDPLFSSSAERSDPPSPLLQTLST